jgi:hypothetical protein
MQRVLDKIETWLADGAGHSKDEVILAIRVVLGKEADWGNRVSDWIKED